MSLSQSNKLAEAYRRMYKVMVTVMKVVHLFGSTGLKSDFADLSQVFGGRVGSASQVILILILSENHILMISEIS